MNTIISDINVKRPVGKVSEDRVDKFNAASELSENIHFVTKVEKDGFNVIPTNAKQERLLALLKLENISTQEQFEEIKRRLEAGMLP